MAQSRGTAPLENRIRPRRQAAGLSQQELARRCGCTRQAINAIEAGHYVPSTLVALCIARVLGSRVEDLFRLTEAHPQIEAEWLGASAAAAGRMRVQLARVGERLFARPLTGAQALFTAADGLARPMAQTRRTGTSSGRRVTVDLLIDAEILEHTVVVLGCDPALALLATHLSRRYPGFRLSWIHSSSLAALRLLGRGEAHAAGTHLWDPDSGEYNLPYIRRELAGHRLLVVTLSQWQQGLIVARGNPKGISSPAELARRDVTLVNRELGSGSRTLLDVWLRGTGITATQVQGYSREVSSHIEVAAAIASGMSDVGPGILAVAQALELDFIPLQEERYDLVIPLEFLNAPAFQALLEIVVSRPFQEELEALGGYDSSQAGTVVAELAS